MTTAVCAHTHRSAAGMCMPALTAGFRDDVRQAIRDQHGPHWRIVAVDGCLRCPLPVADPVHYRRPV